MIKRAARDIFAVLIAMIFRAFATTVLLSIGLSTACGPVDGRDDVAALGPIDSQPYFVVSDFFTPSGHMGDGAKAGFITMDSERSCGVRGMCYNFDYQPGANRWAGVYWVYPSNNWGSRNGRRFKPWRYDEQSGTLYQRYNQVQFNTSATQDTFRIELTGTDSTGKVYTLRNAVFQVDGPSTQTVTGNWYLGTTAGSHATLAMKPGQYAITLQPGWSLESVEMGAPVAAAATLPVNPVEISMFNRNQPASSSFDFQVGAETVRLGLSTPLVTIEYYAGSIGDTAVLRIACPVAGTRCEHRDTVFTSSSQRRQTVSREAMPVSLGISVAPPCVGNAAGDKPQFANKNTGVVSCPDGTITAAGDIAMCDGAFNGAMNADGSIVCCATGDPTRVNPTDPWTCPMGVQSIPGVWQNANAIESWVIGGFGWALNYAEFEAQNALISSNMGQPGPLTNLPPTHVYVDDIVWNFVTTP